MKVYFMRHAETNYNLKNLINEIPSKKVFLTERGKRQARSVAKKLEKIKFDAVYVSEFYRTQETAKVIFIRKKVKISVDKRLNEIKFGFENQKYEKYLKARENEKSWADFRINKKYESFSDVKERVSDFFSSLSEKKYRNVLVIAHEAVLMAAYSLLKKLDLEKALRMKFGNCELFTGEI